MDPNGSDYKRAAKAWRLRNSDMAFTWEGDRLYSPPAIAQEQHDLPDAPHRLTTPDATSGYTARALRHVHIFDPALDDPST